MPSDIQNEPVHIKLQREDSGSREVFEASLESSRESDCWRVSSETRRQGCTKRPTHREQKFKNFTDGADALQRYCKDRMRRGFTLQSVTPANWAGLTVTQSGKKA